MSSDTNTGFVRIEPLTAYSLAESIAEILNNSIHHYWFSDTDADTATTDCYQQVRTEIDKARLIVFYISNGDILVNGDKLHHLTHNIDFLIDHLESLNINNLTLQGDLDAESFANLLEVLEASEAELEQLDGFDECIKRFNIHGVGHKSLVYKQVDEDEIVVDKKEVQVKPDSDDTGTDTVGNILAFLKGDLASDDPKAIKNVQDAAPDASKMADLILNATEIRQQECPIEGGESMVDFVVGCLRRTYHSLTQQKAIKTKTGKKRITKNLLLLEKEVIDRMRDMSMEWSDDDLQAIVDATEEMTDELKIDSLADEYMASQKTSEQMQKHILDYIESVGIDNVDMLKQKLSDRGINIGDWKELVIADNRDKQANQQGLADGLGGGHVSLGTMGNEGGSSIGSLVETIAHLDVLFGNMEQNLENIDEDTRQVNSNKLIDELTDVKGHIEDVTAETCQKIDSLTTDIETDNELVQREEECTSDGPVNLKLDREAILSSMLEIIKEVSEPLLAIRTSLSIISSKTMGDLNPSQQAAVRLASDNAEMIYGVMKRLETSAKRQ